MSPWNRNRAEIELLLQKGELEVVAASLDHASRLLDESWNHLRSAEQIADENPSGALNLAYDAARQAANSLLAAQGLRATSKGGHIAVQDAVNHQFNGPFAALRRLRRQRNTNQYPAESDPAATRQDAEAAVAAATEMAKAAERLMSEVSPWELDG